MDENLVRRAERLKDDFDRQPCGKKHAISLEELSDKSSRFSKELSLGDCVIDFDNSGSCLIQGGVLPIVVDFAGVYLARMHSDNPGITPLANLDESYFKPFILGSDKKIIARANIFEITDSRIIVSVVVENEKGEVKGRAKLKFAFKFCKT